MNLLREKEAKGIRTSVYETNGYQVSISVLEGDPPMISVSCRPVDKELYKPKIVCSPSGICINYENISVYYDENSQDMDAMIDEAQKAKEAAREIYSLLKPMNFFA